MNSSTEIQRKPLISILMAIYEPRMDWLKEQLDSLNKQTYPNIKLYIRDDCSPTTSFENIKACVQKCITVFPYEIRRNEKNLGSNGTFEALTMEAEGEYFAYCDQDDIWLPQKLTVLQEAIEREGALLVCSDMLIIDGEGKQTADSITALRHRHKFKSGSNLASQMLISNFVTGCTMLVDADQARASVPFCPHMVHDHYLALWCAEYGKVVSLQDRLIYYRIHASNQTLTMAGLYDKQSYYRIRIEALTQRLIWLKARFKDRTDLLAEIDAALKWSKARQRNFEGDFTAKWEVLRSCRFSYAASMFELALSWAPDRIFMFFIRLVKQNIL